MKANRNYFMVNKLGSKQKVKFQAEKKSLKNFFWLFTCQITFDYTTKYRKKVK